MQLGPRIQREQKTIEAMIKLFCSKHHRPPGNVLCNDCTELFEYAMKRLNFCPFQETKPTCGECTKHCYKPAMQAKVIQVMKYSGPRMILHHPVLALFHLLDSYRKNQIRQY